MTVKMIKRKRVQEFLFLILVRRERLKLKILREDKTSRMRRKIRNLIQEIRSN